MKKQEKVSFYPTILSKKPTCIFFYEFITLIKGPRYEPLVTKYRQLVAEGDKAGADQLKRSLNAISVGATFHDRHAHDRIEELSGLMSIDLDDTNERTEEIVELLSALPYVLAVIRTVSGRGVKPFIRIGACTPEEYRQAYDIVAAYVCCLVNFACDKQCGDITRLCFGTHDPQAYYNPDAEVFPWRDRVGEEELSLPAPVDGAGDGAASAGGDASADALAGGNVTAGGTATASTGCPFQDDSVGCFLEEFLQWNPFVEGERHHTMLKLGRKAASKNFSEEELEILIRKSVEKLRCPDYGETNFRNDILSGYQYVNKKKEEGLVSGLTKGNNETCEDDFSRIDLLENNQSVQTSLPYIPQEVYEGLPDLLRRALAPVTGKRESDFLLMAVLANLGACLPKVRFRYASLEYACHFYFAAVASAASGKGVVAHATGISYPLHKFLYDRSMKAYKAYKADLQRYQLEFQKAMKEGKEFTKEEPKEPLKMVLQLSGNCSKASLVHALRANGDQGVVINASEINTLVSSIGQEYGKMDDLFCAATHHESYGRSFVNDGETINIEKVYIAFSMSGTPQQYIAFVRSPENGFCSRIAALTAQAQCDFRSCQPHAGSVDLHAHLCEIGEEVLQIYLTLVDMPESRIEFTEEQWARHTAFFGNCLVSVRFEGGEDSTAIVLRFALLMMRLAALFTVLRKYEDGIFASVRYCSDADFEAALSMIDVLMKHSLHLSTLLPTVPQKKLDDYNKILNVIREMSQEFTYSDFRKVMSHHKYSKASVSRWLERAANYQFIVKEGNKYLKTGFFVSQKPLSET